MHHGGQQEGLNEKGQPIPNPEKEATIPGVLVSPASGGATNWPSPSFDPETGLFYVSTSQSFSIFYLTAEGKADGWGGRGNDLWGNSTLRALDYRTVQPVWNHELGEGTGSGGILTTAGNLLFTADTSGNLLALDPANGQTLWHLYAGGQMQNGPITYELDGRQYVLMAVEDTLYAFALPQNGNQMSARK